MHIKLIQNIEELYSVREDWNNLFEKCSESIFIHYSWVYNNYRVFGQTPLIIVIYNDNKEMIAALPFTIKPFKIKSFTYQALSHGTTDATDYACFLISPNANSRLIIKRVIQYLLDIQKDRWHFYKFDNLSDGSTTSSLFRHVLLKELYGGEIVAEITPIIDFSRVYEEPKKASNINRRFKKIVNKCNISHKKGKDILPYDMAQFSKIHQHSYPNSAFDSDKNQDFYRSLIEDHTFGSQVILSSIKEDETLVASHFGFIDSDTFYYYVPTYDENFSQFGPGQFLLRTLVEDAKKNECHSFDLLRGSESYKYNWVNRIQNNYSVLAVRNNDKLLTKLLVNFWLIRRSLPFFKN